MPSAAAPAQDPAGKPGVGNMVADLLDEGSGDLDSKTFHERLDRRAIELSFTFDAGLFPRLAAHAQGQQGRSLRPAADGADLAAFRQRRCRAHSRAGDFRPAPRHHQPDLARQPQVPGNRLWRPPLWPARQRHAGKRAENRGRRPEGLCPPRAGQGYAEDRRGRRCRPRHARQAARQDLRRLAGQGQPDAGPRRRGRQAAAARVHSARRAADRGDVRRPRHSAPRSEFHGRLCRQPHSRRRRPVVAALHEVREKRGLAYSVYESLLWMDHSALFVGNTGTRADRAGETVEAIDKEIRRIAEEGPTQTGAGRGQVLSEGLADAGARHLVEAGAGAAAIPARQAADRLYREAQRHRRRRDARRRQKGRAAAVGPGPAHRDRRPRPASRRPARRRPRRRRTEPALYRARCRPHGSEHLFGRENRYPALNRFRS